MLRCSVKLLASVKRDKKELGAVKYYWYVAKDACVHLYHGFRLFGVNTKVAFQLARRLRQGVPLTRRERVLLETATTDLLRLIPFSFFVVVPFAELLLPIALKMFPTLIPSTFETETQGRNRAFARARAQARAKQRLLEFATSTTVALRTPDPKQQQHLDLFARAHRGDAIPASMIRDVAPLFQPEAPLGIQKLPADVIRCLAKVSGVYKPYMMIFPNAVVAGQLRYLMERKWTKLKADDVMLEKEGFGDLTRRELEVANQMRGMRWVDNTEALLEQLQGWVDLSVNDTVPYHTLFFFKPTANSLSDSIKTCPIEARRKLLGMQTLPAEVQLALDRLCDHVESKDAESLEKTESTTALARRVDKLSQEVLKTATKVDDLEVKTAIAAYLHDAQHTEACFNGIKEKHGKVTIATAVECLAAEVHHSTHVVSNVFDTFEMGEGSKELTTQDLQALAKRCLEDAAVATVKPAATK